MKAKHFAHQAAQSGGGKMVALGQLERVLKDDRVMAAQDIMAHYDQAAGGAQKSFRTYALIFILATALAALAAALILFGAGAGDAVDAHPVALFVNQDGVRNFLYMVEVGALAASAFAAHIQESRQHSSQWSDRRRRAEELRIELFQTILTVANEADQDTKIAAYDHFVSAQLDGQIRYFETGKHRHGKRASRFAIYGAIIAVVVALAGYGGHSDYWLPLAALAGVVAPIFLTALSSWRDTGNDAEKAARYGDVWTALRRLKGQSSEVRKALHAGDDAAAARFVDAVHAILQAELDVWTETLQSQATS